MADLTIIFKEKMRQAYLDFKLKMEQGSLFQIQERLAETIILVTKERNSFAENELLIATYNENALNLSNTGKTYKNVLEEKIFTDGFRVFEEFLADIFTGIFEVFPFLLLGKEGKETREVIVPFDYIFTSPNIEGCKALIVENRVKTYMQGDNISKIVDRFHSTFNLTLTLTEDEKIECQRIALIRNIITHNNSVINDIYIFSIAKFKIRNNFYSVGDSILPHLESEINGLRATFESIAQKIVYDLITENNLKTLDERNKSLST